VNSSLCSETGPKRTGDRKRLLAPAGQEVKAEQAATLPATGPLCQPLEGRQTRAPFCIHGLLALIEREYSNGSHLGVGECINEYYAPTLVISCLPGEKPFGVISQNLAAGHNSGLRVIQPSAGRR
jgi:hypothetical protein